MTAAGSAATRPGIASVTVLDEGDDVLLGQPASGAFVAVPAVGGVVIRALQRGATPTEAAAEAAEFAGEPVDVEEFLTGLTEAGVLPAADTEPDLPRRTAPIQQRGWVRGPAPRLVRPLFGRVAWTVYAAAAMFAVGCLAVRPDLFPVPSDAFAVDDAGLALLVLIPVGLVQTGWHEVWHWLAARSLGLEARFGVDRRLYFIVFETDLSQLWTVPRRRRYGPQLAGLALDGTHLAVLLAVSLVGPGRWYAAGSFTDRAIAALVFITVFSLGWQSMVFLRTDLYGVLVTATGCRNLWAVKSLLLRRAFGRLSPAGEAELADAHPRDLAVGSWFRWLYLGGLVAAAGYFGAYYVPIQLRLLEWTADGLRAGPVTVEFWRTALIATVFYLSPALALWMWLTKVVRREADPTPT